MHCSTVIVITVNITVQGVVVQDSAGKGSAVFDDGVTLGFIGICASIRTCRWILWSWVCKISFLYASFKINIEYILNDKLKIK